MSSSRHFLLRYAPDCTFSSRKIKNLPTGGTPPFHPLPPLGRYALRRAWSLRSQCSQRLRPQMFWLITPLHDLPSVHLYDLLTGGAEKHKKRGGRSSFPSGGAAEVYSSSAGNQKQQQQQEKEKKNKNMVLTAHFTVMGSSNFSGVLCVHPLNFFLGGIPASLQRTAMIWGCFGLVLGRLGPVYLRGTHLNVCVVGGGGGARGRGYDSCNLLSLARPKLHILLKALFNNVFTLKMQLHVPTCY